MCDFLESFGAICGAGVGLTSSTSGSAASRPIPRRPADPGQPGEPSDPGVPGQPIRPPTFRQARFVHQLGGEFHRDRIFRWPVARMV